MIPAPADVAAPPADATTTSTGLASRVVKTGTGTNHPSGRSRVRVHYSGWTTDGKMFDSSVARNEPISFGLNQVIPGWTRVQLMVERKPAVSGSRRSSLRQCARRPQGACSCSTWN